MRNYDDQFFSGIASSTRSSAEVIVPRIIEMVRPQRVIDIGCGTGTWLSVFKQQGVPEVLGVDGAWVPRDKLEIAPAEFVERDLTQPFRQNQAFDLAVSLEVAEHIDPGCAYVFVETLVNLSDVILFSAAIPFQGGTHHVNEQWPQYWADRFAAHDYQLVDCFRRELWHDARVEFYYLQNMFLYVRSNRLSDMPHLNKLPLGGPLDVVHPKHYLSKAVERTDPRRLARFGVRVLLAALWLALSRAVSRRWKLGFL